MRDVLLSGTAGFLFSCTGGFIVHRALWKSAHAHAKQLDTIVDDGSADASKSNARQHTESFESFIGRRVAQWWNSGVDNVHSRLVGLPGTVNRIVDDVKDVSKSESNKQAD